MCHIHSKSVINSLLAWLERLFVTKLISISDVNHLPETAVIRYRVYNRTLLIVSRALYQEDFAS